MEGFFTSLEKAKTTWSNSIHSYQFKIADGLICLSGGPSLSWMSRLHHTHTLLNMSGPGNDCLFYLTCDYYGNICVVCMCATEQRCNMCQGFHSSCCWYTSQDLWLKRDGFIWASIAQNNSQRSVKQCQVHWQEESSKQQQQRLCTTHKRAKGLFPSPLPIQLTPLTNTLPLLDTHAHYLNRGSI